MYEFLDKRTKKQIKLLIIILSLAFLITSFIISEITWAKDNKSLVLSLEESIELVLKNSISYQLASLELKDMKIEEMIRRLDPIVIEEEEIKLDLDLYRAEQRFDREYINVVNNTIKDYFDLIALSQELEIKAQELFLAKNRIVAI